MTARAIDDPFNNTTVLEVLPTTRVTLVFVSATLGTVGGAPQLITTLPQSNLVIIGSCSDARSLVLFTTSQDNRYPGATPGGNYGQIWLVDMSEYDQATFLAALDINVHLRYNGQLDFSLRHEVNDAILIEENDCERRLFWVDGRNPYRTLSLADAGLIVQSPDLLTHVPTAKLTPARFIAQVPGSLKRGMYQLVYRLGSLSGTFTQWAPSSKIVPVAGLKNSTYEDTIGNDVNGAPSDIGLQFRVDNLSTDFETIQVAALYYADENGLPQTSSLLYDGPVTGTSMVFNHTQDSYSLGSAEVTSITNGLTVARAPWAMRLKNSRIVLGRYSESRRPVLDFTGVTHQFVTRKIQSDNITGAVPPYSVPIVGNVRQSGTLASLVAGYTPPPDITLDGDFTDSKGVAVSSELRGFMRGETELFAVVLHLKSGEYGFGQRLTDPITFPRIQDSWPTYQLIDSSRRINVLGISFSGINLAAHASEIQGFMIVRARRVKTTVAQVVAYGHSFDGQYNYFYGPETDTGRVVPQTGMRLSCEALLAPVEGGTFCSVYAVDKGPLVKWYTQTQPPVVADWVPSSFEQDYKEKNYWRGAAPYPTSAQCAGMGNEATCPAIGDWNAYQAATVPPSPTATAFSEIHERLGVWNLKQPFVGYGPDDTLEFIPTGHYQRVDAANSGTVPGSYIYDNQVVFGGDTFVTLYERFHRRGFNYSLRKVVTFPGSSGTLRFNSGIGGVLGSGITVTGLTMNDLAAAVNTSPLLSPHVQAVGDNANQRVILYGLPVADPRVNINVIGIFGANAIPPDIQPSQANYPEYGYVIPLESTVNSAFRYYVLESDGTVGEKLLSKTPPDTVWPLTSYYKPESFGYFGTYSREETLRVFAGLPRDYDPDCPPGYPYRVIPSELHQSGGRVNALANLLATQARDVNPAHGPINALASRTDEGASELFVFQDTAYSTVVIGDRAIRTTDKKQLKIEDADLLISEANYLSIAFGCMDLKSVVEARQNIYWFDKAIGRVRRHGPNGHTDLSQAGTMLSFFDRAGRESGPFQNPALLGGLVGEYDLRRDEYLLTYKFDYPALVAAGQVAVADLLGTTYSADYDPTFTVVFSEGLNTFPSFLSTKPHLYLRIPGGRLASPDPQERRRPYLHHASELRNVFYAQSRASTPVPAESHFLYCLNERGMEGKVLGALVLDTNGPWDYVEGSVPEIMNRGLTTTALRGRLTLDRFLQKPRNEKLQLPGPVATDQKIGSAAWQNNVLLTKLRGAQILIKLAVSTTQLRSLFAIATQYTVAKTNS